MSSENLTENIDSTLSFLKSSAAKPLPPDELQVMLAYNMIVPAQIRGHLMGRPAPYEDALKKITVPVLVSHGKEDRMALIAMAGYTASVVSHAHHAVLGSCSAIQQ
jgi:pimeloyl-ACP methyl ester carboxylesterase